MNIDYAPLIAIAISYGTIGFFYRRRVAFAFGRVVGMLLAVKSAPVQHLVAGLKKVVFFGQCLGVMAIGLVGMLAFLIAAVCVVGGLISLFTMPLATVPFGVVFFLMLALIK